MTGKKFINLIKRKMEARLFKDSSTIGVIVSRMQVPYLTESHVNMIKTVQSRHNKLAILLGVNDKIDLKNPLSFDLRKQMISPLLRTHDIIIPLRDNEDNKAWVEQVDLIIDTLCFRKETAILYGGRDSFIPYYHRDNGRYETIELLPEDNDSGTELRNIASSKLPVYSVEVAEAIIYTLNKIID
jgi:bifunctional NMN adenylyltransferase/nudix hydrolase